MPPKKQQPQQPQKPAAGKKPAKKVDDDEAVLRMMEASTAQAAKDAKAAVAEAAKKAKAAAAHKARGVTKTVITAGDAKTFPKVGDTLTVHYTGKLKANGAKFDSSVDRGEPFKFQVGTQQVIRGWDAGMIQMSLGEKAKLDITPEYGYGAQGAGGAIPPNADLLFDVELLKIN
jgi:FK506-binding protein 1